MAMKVEELTKLYTNDGVEADIAIQHGKIVQIASNLVQQATKEIDASEQYVLPGMIDTNVHICKPGCTEWEGFETGCKLHFVHVNSAEGVTEITKAHEKGQDVTLET